MWWRLSRSEFLRNRGEQNRKALKNIVDSGKVPGVVAYADSKPIGWCAFAPRNEYPTLERSRILKKVDDSQSGQSSAFSWPKNSDTKGLWPSCFNLS